jgi:hypothetical protein
MFIELIKPSKCELIIINDVPKRLNVIASDAFVRTGPTARNLIISSSGSTEKYHAKKEYDRLSFFLYRYKTRLNLDVKIYTVIMYQNESNEIEHELVQ